MPEDKGECEEIFRWACRLHMSLQNAVPHLEKALKNCNIARGLARRGHLEAAIALKAKIDAEVWIAVGACVDPTKSNEEKVELGRRVFLPASVVRKDAPGSKEVWESRVTGQELRHAREKIEALAHEVAKSRALIVNSPDVLAALAEKGWNAQKIATVWDEYLEDVRKSGKIGQRREAIRDFMEFLRGLEPKAVIEVDSDLGTMDEDQLRVLQGQLLKGLLGGPKE